MSRKTEAGCGTTIAYGIAGAVIFRAIGFFAGLASPLFLKPPASQAPLLGIFFTGPAGVSIGFIIGVLYAQIRPPK